MQAIQGVGIDWTFAEGDGPGSRLLVRLMAVGVSVGGMLITALMLGIVSGDAGSDLWIAALSWQMRFNWFPWAGSRLSVRSSCI